MRWDVADIARPRAAIAEIWVRPCDSEGRAALQRAAAAASATSELMKPATLALMGATEGCALLELEVGETLEPCAERAVEALFEEVLSAAAVTLIEAGYRVRRRS